MPGDDYSWDLFLAHAGADKELAEALYALLESRARTFLDSRRIHLGEAWDDKLAEALKASRITVFLITPQVDSAHYLKEEIATAVALAREDPNRRVVPAFVVEDPKSKLPVPYGLQRLHGITVSTNELMRLAEQLLQLLGQLQQKQDGDTRRKEETVGSQKRALENLTRGSSRERLGGLQEITQFFGPLRWTLFTILIVSLLGIIWCLLLPPPSIKDTRGLAAAGLGAIATGSFGGLMVIINKSIDIAREIAQGGLR